MPIYSITPQDILFFRDGRPMNVGGSSGGHGARWPEPSIIFDALHAALHRAFPTPTEWEHAHRYGRSSDRDSSRERTQRFGSLATLGPFPVNAVEWFFPSPQDVTHPGHIEPTLLPLRENGGRTNLPVPLCYALGSLIEPSKAGARSWWNKAAVETCLGHEPDGTPRQIDDSDLFDREWATGIAVDPATEAIGSGDRAGKIYSAVYLRLRDQVAMGIHAQLPLIDEKLDSTIEGLTHLFPSHRTVICGGQQRVCQVQASAEQGLERHLPLSARVPGNRMKWVLLSPAVFPAVKTDATKDIRAHPGGWLPTWICAETGRVLLRKGDTTRQPGERRGGWRKRVRRLPEFDCCLVAARIPPPIVLTGWTEAVHLKGTPSQREHGPRPTLLAVPAGAVYYFEGPDAPQLASALAWHGSRTANIRAVVNRRSTLLGEKGFGLGVCGPWQFFEGVSGNTSQRELHQPTTY